MAACVTAATRYPFSAAHQVEHLNRPLPSWDTATLGASQTTLWSSKTRGLWWGPWIPGRCTSLQQNSARAAERGVEQEAVTELDPKAGLARRMEGRRGPITVAREVEGLELQATAPRGAVRTK